MGGLTPPSLSGLRTQTLKNGWPPLWLMGLANGSKLGLTIPKISVYAPNMSTADSCLHPSQGTCFNLRKATRVVTQLFDDKLCPSGVRATQFSILWVIGGAQSAPINDLARKLVMDRTTLTHNLKPLEQQGLIESKPGEDRRTRYVALTAQGRNTLEQVLPLWQETQAEVVEQLGMGA